MSLYNDPDPMVEGLQQISVPTLLLIGEFDWVFIKPTELMAKEIPAIAMWFCTVVFI